MRQNILDTCEAPCLRERPWHGWLGLPQVRLVLYEGEVDIVVFGLSSDTQPASLEPREENTDQLSEAGRVEDGDALRRTS